MKIFGIKADTDGFEPSTSWLTAMRSARLNYVPEYKKSDMMLKALSDYQRHCHCSRSNPAITVGMPKNQLGFHDKKENQNDCYQHCHKGQRNDKIRTCISPLAFRYLGASCLDHVALVGVRCRLGLHLCSTVEIHLRCRGTAVNCDAVLLSRLNTVACVAITRFARLVQHQERCTVLSVS